MLYQNITWKYYHGALLPRMAPHIKIGLNKEEQELLNLSKVYFLRYISDWDQKEQNQFWDVIKDNFGALDELSSNTRSKKMEGGFI